MVKDVDKETAWKLDLYRARDECISQLHPPTLPGEVFHYTSPRALINILTTQSVWATHLDYMNDVSELRHAEALLARIVSRAAQHIEDEPEGVQQLLGLLGNGLSPFGPGHAPYAFCTCEDGNLLSQWRAYGSGGHGYSIGFKTADLNLQRENVLQSSDHAMRPIIYDEYRQEEFLTSLITKVLGLVRQRHMDASESPAKYARMFLMFQYMEWAPSFKNALFKEEREWRWMSTVQGDEDDLDSIRFRDALQYPIPYVELHQKGKIGKKQNLPITRIFTGPGVEHERAKAAIETIYRKIGAPPPPVEPSRAPLRL